MLEGYAVFVEGLKDAADLNGLSRQKIDDWARRAINDTLRDGTRIAARQMEKETNFPRGYLTGQNGRLGIAQFASNGNLEGVIRGRDRPTSLARFMTKAPAKGKKGAVVEVNPNRPKLLPGAFLVKLKGNARGLAVRSDRNPAKKGGAVKLDTGLWLLYGPSVDQVFNDVRRDIVPELEDKLEETFRSIMRSETR